MGLDSEIAWERLKEYGMKASGYSEMQELKIQDLGSFIIFMN